MEEAKVDFAETAAASKRFVRRLVSMGENRLELLVVEVQEERERILRAILLTLGVASFGLLATVTLTAAIVVLFWKFSPVAVLLTLTGLYAAAAVCLYFRLTTLLRNWKTLSATIDQLRKDRECLEKKSSVNPLELRKQLLIAESDINRAQLLEDGATILSGVRSFTSKARSISSIASIAGLLATGAVAFRRKKSDSAATKFSWLRTAFKGAKTILPLWLAFRQRSRKENQARGEFDA